MNADACDQKHYFPPPHIFVISKGEITADIVLPQTSPERGGEIIGAVAASADSGDAYVVYEYRELWHYRIAKGVSDSGVRMPSWDYFDLHWLYSFHGFAERLVAGNNGESGRIWLLEGDRVKWSHLLPDALGVNSAAIDENGISILYVKQDEKKPGSSIERIDMEGKKVGRYDLNGVGNTVLAGGGSVFVLSFNKEKVYLNAIDSVSGKNSVTPCPELEGGPILLEETNGMLRGLGGRAADHKFGQFLLDSKCHITGFLPTRGVWTAFQTMGVPIAVSSNEYLYTFHENLEYKGPLTIEVEAYPLLK